MFINATGFLLHYLTLRVLLSLSAHQAFLADVTSLMLLLRVLTLISSYWLHYLLFPALFSWIFSAIYQASTLVSGIVHDTKKLHYSLSTPLPFLAWYFASHVVLLWNLILAHGRKFHFSSANLISCYLVAALSFCFPLAFSVLD